MCLSTISITKFMRQIQQEIPAMYIIYRRLSLDSPPYGRAKAHQGVLTGQGVLAGQGC